MAKARRPGASYLTTIVPNGANPLGAQGGGTQEPTPYTLPRLHHRDCHEGFSDAAGEERDAAVA